MPRRGMLLCATLVLAGCAAPSAGVGRVASDRPAPRTTVPQTVPATPPSPVTAAPPEPHAPAEQDTSSRVATPPNIEVAARASDQAARVSIPATTTPYVVPIERSDLAGWSPTHSSYRATDIFVSGGCGAVIVSPANGVVLEVRRVDSWTRSVDDPATRGGRSVAVRGDDGVRYYMAHFATIVPALVVGQTVLAGEPLGTVGESGRASACHVHFGISPPCPGPEWSVRRGVVWPYPYLDAWKQGRQLSPAAEVAAWVADNPDACALAAAD